MTDLQNAKARLLSSDATCVLCCGETVITSRLRGVRPLVAWRENGTDLNGFCAADKVVGKATAFLYVLHGVKAVYAHVISQAALEVLARYDITADYGTLVEYIINRAGDGMCPFEAATLTVSDPKAAYQTVLHKMKDMNIPITD